MRASAILILIATGQMIHGVMDLEKEAIGAIQSLDGVTIEISSLRVAGRNMIILHVVLLQGVLGKLTHGVSHIAK